MSNDYFKAQGWFKTYALNSQDSRGVFQELVNDISVTLQKKKKVKQMQDNPADFVTDVQSDYDPT